MDWPVSKKSKKRKSSEDDVRSKPQLGNDDSNSVSSANNHIYFYSEVSRKSILNLHKELRAVNNRLLDNAQRHDADPGKIFIHINSYLP